MSKALRSMLLLLLTAAVWGFAMAFQREGSRFLQPFNFNACRFLLGAAAMLPLMIRDNRRCASPLKRADLAPGLCLGVILFAASLLQQMGVGQAGAGKAGFLTALYVVLVPVLGLLMGRKTGLPAWLALLLALPALYLLCVPAGEAFALAPADLMLLLGAVFWALHILCTDRFSRRISALKLCFVQFLCGALLNFLCAVLLETPTVGALRSALIPVLYCGLLSTGLGYLLQTLGQAGCSPAAAALILSLESVFCVIAGQVMLDEEMDARGFAGCALMLLAVLIAQGSEFIAPRKEKRTHV